MLVDLLDENSVASGIEWWKGLTAAGGEGMVVKPYDFIPMRGAELLQPAVKCRGQEYLRIIYGPEYMLEGNLERLKKRSLSKKSGLALGEFALGMEALERFVRGDPLYRVHECVFGVLAMESEPVDPRL
jgi:protein phosphatase